MAAKGVQTGFGIDFGTSTTLVAQRTGAISSTVPIGGGANPWIPSVVGLDDGRLVVGDAAERLPRAKVVRSVKRFLTAGEEITTTPDGSEVKIEQAIRAILRETVDRAEQHGVKLRQAARIQLGCPAIWEASQRRLLLEVAEECGLSVQLGDVIDEPIAAGVAWIKDQQRTVAIPTSKVLVFDPGGGTLDVALLQVRERNGEPEITVLATEGIDRSGDALDESIAADLQRTFGAALKRLPDQHVVSALVNDRARQLKEALSSVAEEALSVGPRQPLVLRYTRKELERTFAAQCAGAMGLVQSVVRAGKMREQQTMPVSSIRQMSWDAASAGIEHVLLVGGLSQVPLIAASLQALFPSATLHKVVQPQAAIVRGLVFAEEFERLNLHRPGFNFEVTYRNGRGEVTGGPYSAYEAFTPLYTRQDLFLQNFDIGYRAGLPKCPPGTKTIELSCRSVDGHVIGLEVNGKREVAFPVPISGTYDAHFTLYTNGDIRFGGTGGVKRLRVERWPSLRGPHHNWTIGMQLEQPVEASHDGAATHARPTRGR